MKRNVIGALLAMVMVIGLFAAYPLPTMAEEQAVRTGIAMVTSFGKSKNAEDGQNGLAQADIVFAAVTVDDEGAIVECVIDTVQSKVEFDATGKIVTDLKTDFPSKQALGDAYGMKAASGIGKEWYEQANALAEFVKGKTADEVLGLAADDTGHLTDVDIASSVTISTNSYQKAVAKAIENAQHLGAQKGDALKLGSSTKISKSKDADGDAAGVGQGYATIMAVTENAEGVITSCAIDAVQANVNFDAAGQVTSDLAAEARTKMELGDEYGMKGASGISKEWYEQVNAFAADLTGKTIEEAVGMTLEEGKPVDLVASVTISVDDLIAILGQFK